jgi:hypothetical protein
VTRKTERLSAAEQAELARFVVELRRCLETGLGVATGLRPARETSPRGLARSRLDCVLHDFLGPAVRDAESIAAGAARALEAEAPVRSPSKHKP